MTAWGAGNSLPEPRKPSSIEKRPFLRGSCHLFFSDPGLCRQQRSLGWIFGLQSLHPKIPFPALNFGRQLTSRRSGIAH
jgi:hypothetical protein